MLKDLLERRSNTIAAMRQLTASPAGTGGDLSDEQGAKFDEMRADLTKLEKDIERAQVLTDAERRMAGQSVTGSGDANLDRELRNFSLVRAIAGQAGIQGVDAARERELSAEIARRAGRPFQGMAVPMAVFHQTLEQRTLTVGSDPAGGYLVQTDVAGAQFIDRLRAALVVRRLGARVLTGLVGNLDLPKLTDSATAGWVAENTALTPSNQAFGKVSLTPKHCGAITELSRNMLQQPSIDVENLVRADFAQILAAAVDVAAINGSGAGAEPQGILGTADIGDIAMGANGGALTADKVRDLIGTVDDANAGEGALSFLTNTKVKTAALKLKDGQGQYLGLPTVFGGAPSAFSNNVPSNLTKGTSVGVCSPLIYGNWSDLILAYWSELDILVNPFEATAYAKGNVQIRAFVTMDAAVRHPESFAAIQDLTT